MIMIKSLYCSIASVFIILFSTAPASFFQNDGANAPAFYMLKLLYGKRSHSSKIVCTAKPRDDKRKKYYKRLQTLNFQVKNSSN